MRRWLVTLALFAATSATSPARLGHSARGPAQRPMQNTVSWAECAPQAPKSSENSRFSTGNRHFS